MTNNDIYQKYYQEKYQLTNNEKNVFMINIGKVTKKGVKYVSIIKNN